MVKSWLWGSQIAVKKTLKLKSYNIRFQITKGKIKLHIQLPTQKLQKLKFHFKFSCFTFELYTNSEKKKKFNVELLTEWVNFFFHFSGMTMQLINEKSPLNITV